MSVAIEVGGDGAVSTAFSNPGRDDRREPRANA